MIEIKKKKKKKKWIFWLILLCAVGVGTLVYRNRMEAVEAEENKNMESAVVLEDGQYWKLLRIDNIIGNEMEATQVEESPEGYVEVSGAESKAYQILVGTCVVTTIQSETTFSRLANGDIINCLMESSDDGESILKIWMKE